MGSANTPQVPAPLSNIIIFDVNIKQIKSYRQFTQDTQMIDKVIQWMAFYFNTRTQ
jgi:hypothetical protein